MEYLSFSNNFFQKIRRKVPHLEIQLILLVGLKYKKLLDSLKSCNNASLKWTTTEIVSPITSP